MSQHYIECSRNAVKSSLQIVMCFALHSNVKIYYKLRQPVFRWTPFTYKASSNKKIHWDTGTHGRKTGLNSYGVYKGCIVTFAKYDFSAVTSTNVLVQASNHLPNKLSMIASGSEIQLSNDGIFSVDITRRCKLTEQFI